MKNAHFEQLKGGKQFVARIAGHATLRFSIVELAAVIWKNLSAVL